MRLWKSEGGKEKVFLFCFLRERGKYALIKNRAFRPMPETSAVSKVCSGNCRNQQEGEKNKLDECSKSGNQTKGQGSNGIRRPKAIVRTLGNEVKETAGNKASGKKKFCKNFEF